MPTTQLDNLRGPPAATGGGAAMRAVVQDRYGDAPEDVLGVAEIDRPTIGDDEVLVRVHAASVDGGTWHIMVNPWPPRDVGTGVARNTDAACPASAHPARPQPRV